MLYYLSLGSNLGDRESAISSALDLINSNVGTVLRRSSFYYSEPWGFCSPHPFCNLCCAVQSDLAPLEVLQRTQQIESALGRTSKSTISNPQSPIPHYTDRCIDIDLIRVFDDGGKEVFVSLPELIIPHKYWTQREFVTIPLSEIMH